MDRALAQATDALAVFRLVRLLQQDTIIEKQRNAVLVYLERTHPKVATLGYCPHCLSIWCALGVVIARKAAPRAWGPLAEILAASAVAGILTERA